MQQPKVSSDKSISIIFCSIKGYDIKNNFVISMHEGSVAEALQDSCLKPALLGNPSDFCLYSVPF